MPQLLSLSRAARLAGLSRGELQAQIREQGIPTFEGKIAVEELLRAYPSINMDRDPVLERLALIKAEARPKSRYTDNWLPEPEVLMARLKDFQAVLSRTKSALNGAQVLLADVALRLEEAVGQEPAHLREKVQSQSRKIRHALDMAQAEPDRKAELFAKQAMLHVVSAKVRVLPSGHEYFVQGRDTLLGAALKAGLHLDYGCSSGNCGSCKVQVLKGSVRRVRKHDFVLSAQEQEQGFCLACSNTAVSDVVIEASEALKSEDLPQQEIRCALRKIEPVSEELFLLNVQTPRTKTLRFMAGQRVRVGLESGHARELAVASCPCDGRNLEFLIRYRPGDPFAGVLLAGPKGQTLLITGPMGDFLLEEDAMEPAVFVAVGDGLAPIKSLVQHAIAIDNAARIHLYRIDSVPQGSLLGNLCRSWQDALDNFFYRRLEPETTPEQALNTIVGDCGELGKCRLYAAGPKQWTQKLLDAALACGAHPPYLRGEFVD